MKKMLTLGLAALTSVMAYGQVDVTFQVDVTDYVAAGNAVAANGLRVGGNFATAGATNGSLAMADWSPTDTGSAISISVDEPAVSGLSVYPNPANGPVAIAFTAKASSTATINVFNVLGQRVNSFDAAVFAGKNEIRWNLDAANGSLVENGNYLLEVVVDGEKSIQRVAVSR
ncbi:MAG: T9SS C-terminal target domain-containing protein [Flavobacteriia bacterium]|nr:T9SS C-terminal target domain-containing protein [Flavobacteriia bacterium]